jgi:hypothetical protein
MKCIKKDMNLKKTIINKVQRYWDKLLRSSSDRPSNSQIDQLILANGWKLLENSGQLNFTNTGFRQYSQHDEDGHLLFIFTILGTLNKTTVEICCGDGLECNSTNLIINHGWSGLLVDGDLKNIEKADRFFKGNLSTYGYPPKCTQEWVTCDNINNIVHNAGISGEIDLLSIDVDGVDYWLWNAISVVSPRVVVVEVNTRLGPEESITVPYDPNFQAQFTGSGYAYAGASLKALEKLGQKKGYSLVGTNLYSTNAYFIRKDLMPQFLLHEQTALDCFRHPRAIKLWNNEYESIRSKEWVSV